MIDRVKHKLYAVRDELFKLGVDGIIDPAQTSKWFALSGYVDGQASWAISTDCALFLQAINFVRGLLNPFDFIFGRRGAIAGRDCRVQTTQASPLAQVLL